jgi:hypothetical protein
MRFRKGRKKGGSQLWLPPFFMLIKDGLFYEQSAKKVEGAG